MRIFNNLMEAYKEAERDLWEMGVVVTPRSMQDKREVNPGDFRTKELQGYGFTVFPEKELTQRDKILSVAGIRVEYCELEVSERFSGGPLNPGTSYKIRPEIWEEYLHNGKFSYTYSERLWSQLPKTLELLDRDPETRQAIFSIYDRNLDNFNRGGLARIPCSMYYQFMIRDEKVDLIYTMRSCDFLTHFPADIYMATRAMDFIAMRLGREIGKLVYFTGSLHAYFKDMQARGIF